MFNFDIEKFRGKNRTNIEGVILMSLALAGLVAVAVVAPNALQLLKYVEGNRRRNKHPKYILEGALERLKNKGCVYVTKNGKVRMTQKGKRHLYFIEYGVYPLPDAQWDKKWRMVMFDVSEKRKISRDKLRLILHRVGFVRLQDSVWVYPFDVEEVIELIKTANFLNREVLYVTANSTGKDSELKKHFKIS